MSTSPAPGIQRSSYIAPVRPKLVPVLAVVHLLVLILLMAVLALPGAGEALARFTGGSVVAVVLGAMVISAVLVASIVGLWLGHPWGWWLTAVLYAYFALNSLLSIPLLPSLPEISESRQLYFQGRLVSRAFGSALVLALLLRPKVLFWCALPENRRGRRLALVLGLGIVLVGAAAGLLAFSGREEGL